MSSLSVCLISKNEEKNIRRCLESIKHISNEIILVDTGSTDSTVDIAKEYNVKIFNTIWENDFSKPRNISIENATCEWILLLDCDEALPEESGNLIKQLIDSNPNKEAFHLKIKTILSGQDSGLAIVLRLFRNRKIYRFVGKMHEQIINSIIDYKGHESIGMAEIIIDHYGYDPEIVDQNKKTYRNLEILLSYDDKDKDGYYFYALGNEYSRLGDNDKALENYEICLNMTNYKKNRNIYYSYLCINIIKMNYNLKKYHIALEYLKKFKSELVNFRDLYFMEAMIYIDIGMFTKARESLLYYTNCTEQNFEYPSNDFNKSYNIKDILSQVNQNCVGNYVSTIVFVSKKTTNIIQTIRSINEISTDVLVVIDSSKIDILNEFMDTIRDYKASVLSLKKENLEKALYFISKKTKSNLLLILKEDEIVPYNSLALFSNLPNYSKVLGFNVNVQNIDRQTQTEELKIIKVNKTFKNINQALSLIKNNQKNLVNTNITIYKGDNF